MENIVKIILNSAECTQCGDVLVSRFVHDYKECECRSIFIDGGLDYLRRGGALVHLKELSIMSDAPFEVIRKNFERGTFGEKGTDTLHWIKLIDMSDKHLIACLSYCQKLNLYKYYDIYLKEKEYRGL